MFFFSSSMFDYLLDYLVLSPLLLYSQNKIVEPFFEDRKSKANSFLLILRILKFLKTYIITWHNNINNKTWMYNLYVYRRSLHRALDKYLIGFLLSHQLCSYKSFFNVGQRVLQVCGQHSPLRPLRRHPSTYPQRMQPVLY